MDNAKPFCIPKRWVWKAYKRVKANRGAAGVDEQSVEQFEEHLKGNLYKLWNRLSSGSYFPPPVKRVDIAKRDGGTRPLGIPTVADRTAAGVGAVAVSGASERSRFRDAGSFSEIRSPLFHLWFPLLCKTLGLGDLCWRHRFADDVAGVLHLLELLTGELGHGQCEPPESGHIVG